MKTNFNLSLYILQSIFGFLCSFIGHIFLQVAKNTLYTFSNTTLMQNLANHAIAGILLAFIGFLLLFYLVFVTAFFLLSHWYTLKYILRIFTILWIFLLFIATLYNAISIYHILGYLFVFAILIFSICLIFHYFHPEI
ncbi:hypothetical protein EV214_1449 [Marinisporobacter balticus]|uniref:Uncharacterized protein n=1 Tax=Marinisporobacter balticus TaxID=2018667 RepID=A0A4R2K950_9FIRM|nr:hypothetical protein EV214_1449 [Marinisporobacter balticus]